MNIPSYQTLPSSRVDRLVDDEVDPHYQEEATEHARLSVVYSSTPRRNEMCRSTPKQLRSKLSLAIILTIAVNVIFVVVMAMNDDDNTVLWIAKEYGVRGILAHSTAQTSSIYQEEKDATQSSSSSSSASYLLENKFVLMGSSRHSQKNDYEDPHYHHDVAKKNHTTLLQDGCESTVMIIRHCEKQNIKSHCDYVGYERSFYLSGLFGNDDDDKQHRWPAPSAIYALKTGRKHHENFREIETVQAIADTNHVPINAEYGTRHTRNLANDIITNQIQTGDMCGKLIVISWKHSDIPHLAQRLGCGPSEGCPLDYKGREFDTIWQIKYVYRSFREGNHRRHHKPTFEKHWKIYGSVQYENFDPLAFSKQAGDYPSGGTPVGARWATTSAHPKSVSTTTATQTSKNGKNLPTTTTLEFFG